MPVELKTKACNKLWWASLKLRYSSNRELFLFYFIPYSAKQKLQQTTFQFFYFDLLKKIRLDFSCEDSLETSSLIFSEKQ